MDDCDREPWRYADLGVETKEAATTPLIVTAADKQDAGL